MLPSRSEPIWLAQTDKVNLVRPSETRQVGEGTEHVLELNGVPLPTSVRFVMLAPSGMYIHALTNDEIFFFRYPFIFVYNKIARTNISHLNI